MAENYYAQRGHCRHKPEGTVLLELRRADSSVAPGTVLDYSAAGLGIHLGSFLVEVGELVDLRLEKEGVTWNGRGYVRHCIDGRVGIEFDSPSLSILEMMGKGGCTDPAYLLEIAMRNARRRGKDVDALADDIGVPQATLHAIVSGQLTISRLSAESLRKLAHFAGVTVVEAYLAAGLLNPQDIQDARDIVALLA